MLTTSIILFVFLNRPGNVLLQDPQRLLGDFFLCEIVNDDFFDQPEDVLVALSEIFGEFVKNHVPELLSLLDSLGLLNRRMQFPTLAGPLGFSVVLDFTHLSYIIAKIINHALTI